MTRYVVCRLELCDTVCRSIFFAEMGYYIYTAHIVHIDIIIPGRSISDLCAPII